MKRLVVLFTLVTILVFSSFNCTAQNIAADSDSLYHGFLDPPHDFSPMPFWFWNGKMEGPIIQKQIRDMVDQHVYGAFLHGRDGLQTPYLSEEWFKAIGAGLEQAKTSGFEFNFVDEYDWPSGEVRNVWMAGNHQSEVLAKRPDLRMKTLAFESKIIDGPHTLDLAANQDLQAVVAARWLGKDRIDATTLTLLSPNTTTGNIRWVVPEGQWVVVQFSLKPAMGFDGGFVDLMDPDSTALFFNTVYGEYHRRFASYFGSTIRYSFSDHEGDYGYRIAWTPKLFSAFQERTGYDLRKVLPLLIYNGGDETTKVRTDYLATVTQLYGSSFWEGITNSAQALGVHRTGHAWEESLQWAAALEGNLFTVERGLNPVGVDSLLDYGRQPLNFKLTQSVADYEGRRFMCENQGVQGTDSYLDLESIRKGTNAIGAWGVNLFVPHAFNYDLGRANYPPDWLHQPYWQYFHTYADYTRRISYMNADSHHVTNVLLYYPITSMWADTAPLFSGSADYQQIGSPASWKNGTILINDYYTRIILELTNHHWDYNIADDEYIDNSRIEGNELVIGPQKFRAVILPPITTLSQKVLKKLEDFHKAGGIIIGIRLLPTSSPEAGGNDPIVKAGISSIFGPGAGSTESASSEQLGPGSNGAYYANDSVAAVISALDTHVPKDVEVVSGPAEHLYFEHRNKLQQDYYWVVNDTDRTRVNEVHFSAQGIPEKWNALTGTKEPLFYVNGSSGTDIRLTLDPWDAFYVIFHPLTGTLQDAALTGTNAETLDRVSRQGNSITVHVAAPAAAHETYVELNSGAKCYKGTISSRGLEPLTLDTTWQFKPKPERISVPYAKTGEASQMKGERLDWANASFDDTDWSNTWLNEEQNTVRQWQMIGPFPNTNNEGFGTSYPPEKQFDPNGEYEGLGGRMVRWQDYDGNEPHLALDNWNIWMETYGGKSSNAGYAVQFDPELLTEADNWIVSYAHTYLYSPRDQRAELIVAADNWAAIWLNKKQVFAQLRTPFWYEINDNWADRAPVDLHQGWNEVLVKVGKGRGTSSGFYGFSFRVADTSGNSLSGVLSGTSPVELNKSTLADDDMRWYRIKVPPGCVAVVPPPFRKSYRMLVNGQETSQKSGPSVDIRSLLAGESNTLVIVAHRNDPLVSPVQFVTGTTSFSLKPWTQTGLENFSGTAIYTKSVQIPETFMGKRVMLDLGRVSSVADVFVNDEHAGTLVWRPYRLDISKFLKPGKNELRIAITNTEANRRAVGSSRPILAGIDVCGMEGPVKLVPYVDQMLTLYPVQTKK